MHDLDERRVARALLDRDGGPMIARTCISKISEREGRGGTHAS